VFATGLALATLRRVGPDQSHRAPVLAVGRPEPAAAAWQAAWNGTARLVGALISPAGGTDGSGFVARQYAYFRGLKVPATVYETMRALAVRRDRFPDEGRSMERFYFVNSAEWLTRAYRRRDWQDFPYGCTQGTSYREEEAQGIEARLGEGRAVESVVSFGHWDKWFYGIDWYLQARYRPEQVGRRSISTFCGRCAAGLAATARLCAGHRSNGGFPRPAGERRSVDFVRPTRESSGGAAFRGIGDRQPVWNCVASGAAAHRAAGTSPIRAI